MTARDRLFRIADRLREVPAGSAEADEVIHQALGRVGHAPPYTMDMEAARTLLPPGFVEPGVPMYVTDAVYVACRRAGIDRGLPFPHHGGWGATPPWAMCNAFIRAQASLLPK